VEFNQWGILSKYHEKENLDLSSSVVCFVFFIVSGCPEFVISGCIHRSPFPDYFCGRVDFSIGCAEGRQRPNESGFIGFIIHGHLFFIWTRGKSAGRLVSIFQRNRVKLVDFID
jgi:hypothetical protein